MTDNFMTDNGSVLSNRLEVLSFNVGNGAWRSDLTVVLNHATGVVTLVCKDLDFCGQGITFVCGSLQEAADVINSALDWQDACFPSGVSSGRFVATGAGLSVVSGHRIREAVVSVADVDWKSLVFRGHRLI